MTEASTNSVPGWMVAADNHNLGSSGASWLDPESWERSLGNSGKFLTASLLAGYNGFANTARAVGKWAGLDTEQESTQALVSSFDSDLGIYYRNNADSVEMAGFLIGSILPGLAGTKVLNMGQKALQASSFGMVGGNIGKAVGLLTPSVERHLIASAATINASQATAKLMNASTVRALGAGVWQGVLEGFAAEGFVQATMAKNPILDQQDAGDIAWNMLLGGAVSGVVGGAFTAASTFGKLKQAVGAERRAREYVTNRPVVSALQGPDQTIIEMAWDMEATAMPWANKYVDEAGKVHQNPSYAVDTSLYKTKLTKNGESIRTAIHSMTDRDVLLGNMVANASTPAVDLTTGLLKPGYAQRYFDDFMGARRLGEPCRKLLRRRSLGRLWLLAITLLLCRPVAGSGCMVRVPARCLMSCPQFFPPRIMLQARQNSCSRWSAGAFL
jgi:hypothetical protein